MKLLLYIFFLLPFAAGAQKMVLLDRNYKAPFTASDSITLQDVARGAFPLYTADIPAVINGLQTFARQLVSGMPSNYELHKLQENHGFLFLSKNRNIYHCVLQTMDSAFSIPLEIAKGNRKSALLHVNQLLDYLRQNSSLVPEMAGTGSR